MCRSNLSKVLSWVQNCRLSSRFCDPKPSSIFPLFWPWWGSWWGPCLSSCRRRCWWIFWWARAICCPHTSIWTWSPAPIPGSGHGRPPLPWRGQNVWRVGRGCSQAFWGYSWGFPYSRRISFGTPATARGSSGSAWGCWGPSWCFWWTGCSTWAARGARPKLSTLSSRAAHWRRRRTRHRRCREDSWWPEFRCGSTWAWGQ